VVSARSINSGIETSGSGSIIGGGAGSVSWPSAVEMGASQPNAHRLSNIALRCFDPLRKLIGRGLFQGVMSAACASLFLFIILLIRAGPTGVAIGQRRNYTAIRPSIRPLQHAAGDGGG